MEVRSFFVFLEQALHLATKYAWIILAGLCNQKMRIGLFGFNH